MAHNINYNEQTGRYSFFSVKEKAWHGLGQIVEQYPTSKEAIKHAGLDYEVVKSPLFTNGSEIITDFNHLEMNQNTLEVPNYIRVGNGDDVTEKYIFLTTSHDGSGSITAAFTPIRIVCQNTLNASLRNMTNVVRIKHTSGAKQRIENAHKIMGLANTLSIQLENIFNNWTKVRVTDQEVKKLIQLALCPNKETFDLLKKGAEDEVSTLFKNTVEDAFSYAMLSDTQQMDTTKGTLYGAYNAVTGYFQNVRNYKNDEAKLQSIVLGGTAQVKSQKAFELCTDFSQFGNEILNFN